MSDDKRSFPERTYKANVFPGGLEYKISPMTMIIEQLKHESSTPAGENIIEEKDNNDMK